jgi:hypothetical protein
MYAEALQAAQGGVQQKSSRLIFKKSDGFLYIEYHSPIGGIYKKVGSGIILTPLFRCTDGENADQSFLPSED